MVELPEEGNLIWELVQKEFETNLLVAVWTFEQELASSVDDDDYVLPDHKHWESCGSSWSTRAKQVSNILCST